MSFKHLLLIPFLASLMLPAARAQVNLLEQCRVPWIFSEPLPDNLPKKWTINSRHVKLEQQSRLYLQGDVAIEREGFRIRSEQVFLDKENQSLDANNYFRIQTPEVQISAKSGRFLLDKKQFNVSELHYVVPAANGHGDALGASYAPGVIQLNDTSFSTCQDPRRSWNFLASSLKLDANRNEGVAKHLRLRVYDVPVMYIPYVSFPLQGRKTGFLTPDYRYSDYQGVDISVPYYLNLAPNYDATLAPRIISNRGGQIAAEFRYLGHDLDGKTQSEYLYQDKLYNANNRYFVSSEHRGKTLGLDYGWTLERASDVDYFHDLGASMVNSSRSQLSRSTHLSYNGKNIQTGVRTAAYQAMQGYDESIQYLPQLHLNARYQQGLVHSSLKSQLTRFVHKSARQGDRLVLEPDLQIPWEGQSGFFIPRLGARANAYRLQQGDFHRLNGYAALDTGLYFDRFSRRGRETLEPRLFALYVPYQEQEELPIFDSSPIDYNFADYFQPFRYTGYDRLADQQRVVFTLGSRYFDDSSGDQTTHILLGQNIHLNNQLTKIPGERQPRRGETQQLFRLHYRVQQRLYLMLNSTTRELKTAEKTVFALKYHHPSVQSALAYRQREQNLRTANLDSLWNLSQHWQLAARWVADVDKEQTQEAAIGLHYRSCCWQIHVVGRYYRIADEEPRKSINVQLELSGLSNIGKLQYDLFDETPYEF